MAGNPGFVSIIRLGFRVAMFVLTFPQPFNRTLQKKLNTGSIQGAGSTSGLGSVDELK